MSTTSDVARVFTDTEEETYSMFSKPEQAMLTNGQVNRTIIKKILSMKFYNYQYEAMFRFFEAFLCTLRGWGVTPDTTRQFILLKRFASMTNYDYYMEDLVSIYCGKT